MSQVRGLVVAVLAALVVVAAMVLAPGAGAAAPVERLSGPSRVATAAALAAAVYDSADAVVLARADQYADALSGAPLAAKVGGPVLLTASDHLSPEAAAQIERLAPETAYLLGGPSALSAHLEEDLAALGVENVVRVSGPSRFDTALEVARRLGATAAYVVQGNNADPAKGWPDAVSVSALAAFQRRPILLTERDFVPEAIVRAIREAGITEVGIIGGTGVVSEAVEQRLRAEVSSVYRIAGASRYATARAVASQSVNAGMRQARTWLATGHNYPDALAAGAAVAADGGVLLFVDGSSIHGSPDTIDWLKTHRAGFERVRVVGGLGAVSGDVEDDVERILGGQAPSASPTPSPPPPPPPPADPDPEPPAEDCDPAYPGVCIPSPPPDLDCGEIGYRNFRVRSPDPHGFDRDRDGIGCET